MNTIIKVRNLHKIYKKNFRQIHALKNISFSVRKNQILGILGPNGAGKTTLLKIITGIISPTGNPGQVKLFDSEDIEAIKHRIGFLPESPEFFKNISAYELLEFSLKVSGTPLHRERILRMLKDVGLYEERDERVKNFSKGMRQRIGIAQAIIHAPELLILDEPMSGLDPQGRRLVIDIITNYYREGKTILFSTHNLDDIEALCTDVLVLDKGEIQLEKSLAELRENCSYKVEAENDTGKTTFAAENPAQLWELLEDLKNKSMRIIRLQSGIAQQLETYYKKDETDEQN